MHFSTKLFVCMMFGLLSFHINAQDLPPVVSYSPQIYGGENQNWAISQSKDKYIYVANNKGLLEFNGAKWQLYPSPNETIIRTVNVVNDKIYTGCYMEFGYWQKNELGTLVYNSLSKDVDTPLIEDEHFWNIIDIGDWVLFQSLNRIYIYNTLDNTYKIIDSKTRIEKIYKVNGSVYFQKINDGIYKIENGKEILVNNDNIVKQNIVINMFYHQSKLLVQTQDKGFYFIENDVLKEWDITANDLLKTASVYNSIQLKDKSFVLGTISHGIVRLNPQGDIKYQIDQMKGLSNNTVLSLYEDVDSNIWLGLDNGIDCVNIMSQFSYYKDNLGELGTVYSSTAFNNILYLGTNQGLFYKKIDTNDEFNFVEGLKGQVWCLVKLDNKLFCGHNLGTFIIDNDKAEKISDIQGTWSIKSIPGNDNLLLQGNYLGINVLGKTGDKWIYRNKIEGYNVSSRYFEFIGKNEILISHEYQGVNKVKLDDNYTKVIEVTQVPIAKGLSSSLIKYKREILYAYKEGIFKFDSLTKSFQKDSLLSKVFKNDEYVTGKLITDDKTNRIWSFSNNNINYIAPGKLSNNPEIYSVPISNSVPKGMKGFENITSFKDNKYLYGTTSGYVIIDFDKSYNKTHDIVINSIVINNFNEPQKLVNKFNHGDFKNKENNIEFNYSIAEFDKYVDSEYQYQLEGIYDQWSNWSPNPSTTFKNLPFGDYTFNVRGRAGNNLTNNVATYKFTIERPWLLSNLMIALYVLLFVLFSTITHTFYKRHYKKQREKLLEESKKEIALKELENEQQLMHYKNDKLKLDIENKNRELAISTMSLIKKNEFLSSIKNELKSTEDVSKLKSVIKIIDNNINNTDDWKLFEQAFNNADKDFLKKVKAKHPSLTSNDLRLCAYLRLNLSSKEIAPLLNISSRSVEVKRYRLRKKMDLSHEASLANYILEI